MKIEVQGQELDFMDDEGLRSLSTSHAIEMVAMIPSKNLRMQLARFYSDVYFCWIKANGLLAFAEHKKFDTVPIEHFSELVHWLRAIVGESAPTSSVAAEKPAAPSTQETP